ncbi:hypothetical protein LB504_009648 [Fusarium proliferatum]|nr:hypothetical protein LB504_009648 [Fusarium proliferatum]
MKRDRIPHELDIPLMPKLSILVLLYELARCESPIDLEPTVSADDGRCFCRVPAKVVQEGGDSVDFEVDNITEGFVGIDHEDSVEPRSHDVLVDGKDKKPDPIDEHNDVIHMVLLASEGSIRLIWPLTDI